MTIVQLEYLLEVAREGSFAEAARKIHVTQPTLSMQVRKLEEELEILIFDRSSNPLKLTKMGRNLLQFAKEVVQMKNTFLDQLEEEKGVIQGELRLGIIPTLSPYLIPLFVSDFLTKNPDIHLRIEELMTDQIVEKLEKEELDVGILVTPLELKNIIEVPLFYELFVVYTHKDDDLFGKGKIRYKDLRNDKLWLLKEGHCFRNQILNICEHQQPGKKSIQFESGSIETLRRLVDQKYGYTLLPELATLNLSENEYERVRNFEPPQPIREVSLVTQRNFVKQKLLNKLKESILDSVPEILKNKNRGKIIHID